MNGEPVWVFSVVALMLALSGGYVQEIPQLIRVGFVGTVLLLIGAIVAPSAIAATDAGPWTVGLVSGSLAIGYLLARFSSTCPRCRKPLRSFWKYVFTSGRRYQYMGGLRCRSCGYEAENAGGYSLHETLEGDRRLYGMGDEWREKAPALVKELERVGGVALVDEFVDWCRAGGLREVPDDESKQALVAQEFFKRRPK